MQRPEAPNRDVIGRSAAGHGPVRTFVIGLLVLVGLVLVVDFAAAAAAEYRVSQAMREELELSTDPSVRINGFPFLAQAADGEFDEFEVAAVGVPVGALRDVSMEATLRSVNAPLTQLLSGITESVEVRRVTGRVRVRDSDLGPLIGIPDLRIAEPTGDETEEALGAGEDTDTRTAIRLTGSTEVAGQRTQLTVLGILELVDDQMHVTPTDLYLGRDTDEELRVPEPVREPLLKEFRARIDPGELPFTVTPTAVGVDGGSLVIEGIGRNVVISGTGASTG